MQASVQRPDAMILGRPQFDASAPLLRVRGRRVSLTAFGWDFTLALLHLYEVGDAEGLGG